MPPNRTGTLPWRLARLLLTRRTAGRFWHGCPCCYSKPKQNAKFWREKIGDNIKRNRKVSRKLRAEGWSVCRIWECRLKKPDSVIRRIRRMLG
jgi:DNA mismatch endonuclease (patch repair protein)